MNTILIKSLEAVYWSLLLAMLFQIGKHYILCSVSNRKTKRKRKYIKPQTANRRVHRSTRCAQNKPPLNYYVYKLPEPEISISSEQNSHLSTSEHNRHVSTIETPKPKQVSIPQHKTILDNYIDGFFSEPSSKSEHFSKPEDSSKKVQPSYKSALLNGDIDSLTNNDIDSPVNDEIITVTEPRTYSTNSPANDEAFTVIKSSTVIA